MEKAKKKTTKKVKGAENQEESIVSQYARTLEKQGIVIQENLNTVPMMNETYPQPYFVITVCHQGTVELEYDSFPHVFTEYGIVVICPNHTLNFKSVSEDYNATIIAISPSFFSRMFVSHDIKANLEFQRCPHIQLTENQYGGLLQAISLLKTIEHLEPKKGADSLLVNYMNIVLQMIVSFRMSNGIGTEPVSTDRRTFVEFYNALTLYYRKSREVRFYAEKLHLTPKYFGMLIRRETGRGAIDWISHYVVSQAKQMIRYRNDLTIQIIGQELGFPDQATFSRYFKNVEGISPSEFRDKCRLDALKMFAHVRNGK